VGGRQYRPEAGFGFYFPDLDFVEVGDPRILEVAKVSGVIDMTEGVHVAPDDVLVQDDRVVAL
jgi:hypothetical protein